MRAWCVWLVACACVGACAAVERTCLAHDDNPYLLYGTNTAYTFATNSRVQFNTNTLYDVPGCRAAGIWLLARYGTQLPHSEEYGRLRALHTIRDNLIDNYNKGNFRDTGHRMCEADIALLREWSLPGTHNATNAALTAEGYVAMQGLARAWMHRYPELLTHNQHDYKFKFGTDYIASTSFRAFSEGIYGQHADAIDIPRDINDKLVMPHKYCNAWENEIANDEQTSRPLDVFESKHEYKEMVLNVSRRLGYKYNIDANVVKDMYHMCAYNKAWSVRDVSPWCAVFTRQELQLLEYAQDLDNYYKYGYGTTRGQQLGCGFLNDMMEFFERRVQPNELPQQPRAQILLTDMRGIMATLAALHANMDQTPLTPHNYHTAPMQNRKWRTSLMAPYTANMAAVLYKCGDELLTNEHKVLFVLNEQPMNLAECHVGLCHWATVARHARAAQCHACTSHGHHNAHIANAIIMTTIAHCIAFVL